MPTGAAPDRSASAFPAAQVKRRHPNNLKARESKQLRAKETFEKQQKHMTEMRQAAGLATKAKKGQRTQARRSSSNSEYETAGPTQYGRAGKDFTPLIEQILEHNYAGSDARDQDEQEISPRDFGIQDEGAADDDNDEKEQQQQQQQQPAQQANACTQDYNDPFETRNYQLPTKSSRLKQVERSFQHELQVRGIPFVVGTSLSRSHNIGLNVQQVKLLIAPLRRADLSLARLSFAGSRSDKNETASCTWHKLATHSKGQSRHAAGIVVARAPQKQRILLRWIRLRPESARASGLPKQQLQHFLANGNHQFRWFGAERARSCSSYAKFHELRRATLRRGRALPRPTSKLETAWTIPVMNWSFLVMTRGLQARFAAAAAAGHARRYIYEPLTLPQSRRLTRAPIAAHPPAAASGIFHWRARARTYISSLYSGRLDAAYHNKQVIAIESWGEFPETWASPISPGGSPTYRKNDNPCFCLTFPPFPRNNVELIF
ncbi:unnamed protein product [Trichogramma brassicae]|uniref:Uncharacterized protein n=1 Tax=Trichogramma brassicae TaxID=86971 RepID=A0A6H5JBT5_9HYME|nr:unnamed protein product [Trichogramma brassicae]